MTTQEPNLTGVPHGLPVYSCPHCPPPPARPAWRLRAADAARAVHARRPGSLPARCLHAAKAPADRKSYHYLEHLLRERQATLEIISGFLVLRNRHETVMTKAETPELLHAALREMGY